MAGHRKVDNLLALAVLATALQRPMHRYEMASLLRARNKEHDMGVKLSSLYTVVQNLQKHGFLEIAGTGRQGARPEHTVYRITEEGRRELVDWTRELIAEPRPEHPRFAAGLSVVAVLPPDEVIDLLRARLDALAELIAAQRAWVEDGDDVPRLFLAEVEYGLALLEAEAAWVRALLDELITGTYPGLESWQSWHATGKVPAELVALAERGAEPG